MTLRMESTGELLREARRRAGLSQSELAARAGVTQSVVSEYEADKRQPAVPTLARLVDGADPARPVEVVTIALGSGADAKALRNIAATTSGKAYTAARPEDLESVFLAALTG